MFSKIIFWCCLLFVAASENNPQPPKLLWSDEFNKNGMPGKGWRFDEGNGCPHLCGWGNNELQYYTKEKKNVFVKNGKLIIEARKEQRSNSAYTSAKLKTSKENAWK